MKRRHSSIVFAACAAAALAVGRAAAGEIAPESREDAPGILLVVAHPDDEAMFAASVYKITHYLHGTVDLALVTDGSGGFRYSQLAEPIYGLELTDESVARRFLPAIRKEELKAAGELIGIRDYYFLDQYDHAYTESVDTVMRHVWDADEVRARLAAIMSEGGYDYVFVHLPIPDFHAHHKAASLLALQAARLLPDSARPVVLGCFVGERDGPDTFGAADFIELEGYPISRVRDEVPPFIFDRSEPLSADGRLDYTIVVNWVIAEHKSQGTMQLLINRGDIERFWFFAANDPNSLPATAAFFDRLAIPALAEGTATESGER